MDYETYARLWSDDKADEFGILLNEGASMATVKSRIQDVVKSQGVAADVYEKDELVGRILEIVEGSLSLGQSIQLAAVIVAALTIANTMFTAVLERRWEMGLQRAVGMGARQLRRSVLLEAASIGVIGGVGGAILGTITGYLFTQVMELQFSWRIAFVVPGVQIVLAIAGGAVIAMLAGAVPSRSAARAPIIECLRYE
jgi:putative ABC transport system permease protein